MIPKSGGTTTDTVTEKQSSTVEEREAECSNIKEAELLTNVGLCFAVFTHVTAHKTWTLLARWLEGLTAAQEFAGSNPFHTHAALEQRDCCHDISVTFDSSTKCFYRKRRTNTAHGKYNRRPRFRLASESRNVLYLLAILQSDHISAIKHCEQSIALQCNNGISIAVAS